MSRDRTVEAALHEATHRIPGVPEHHEAPTGHQRASRHGESFQARTQRHGGDGSPRGSAPAHGRPPRVLVSWQNRIARLFTRAGD
ncbi:hypothetical protein [Agromyces allii]|uniref:Uncharacterized protein n=1 Tax=Agromyces allii TaxID=393607 RepID=A0ABN2QB74_9MICO|nr:hypothetical protein [Agromyces allii]